MHSGAEVRTEGSLGVAACSSLDKLEDFPGCGNEPATRAGAVVRADDGGNVVGRIQRACARVISVKVPVPLFYASFWHRPGKAG